MIKAPIVMVRRQSLLDAVTESDTEYVAIQYGAIGGDSDMVVFAVAPIGPGPLILIEATMSGGRTEH